MNEELEKDALNNCLDVEQLKIESIDGELENYENKEVECIEQVKCESIWDIELENPQMLAKVNEKCGEIILDKKQQLILVCALCDNQFKSLPTFGDHIISVHTTPEQNGDPLEFLSASESFLEGKENNVLRSEEDSSIAPGNVSYPWEEDVGEEIFECYVCSEAFSYVLYQAHLKVHDESNDSEKRDTKKVTYETVIRSMYPCTKCGNIYRQKKSLKAHMQSVHKNGENSMSAETICKFCKDEFESRDILEKHIEKEHTLRTIYSCRFCDKSFTSSSAHNGHINTHTGARPHKCPHCPKRFSTSTNLRVHIYTHLNIRKYSCKFCGKSFVQSTCRNIHEKRHLGEKRYQCEYCGLQFLLRTRLTSHIKRHLNIRDFKCDVCDKLFFSRALLNNHMTVHSVSRPFKCDQCDRSFPSQRYLQLHRQIHSRIKKYVCNVCGKAFAQSAGLSTHRKSHRKLTNP